MDKLPSIEICMPSFKTSKGGNRTGSNISQFVLVAYVVLEDWKTTQMTLAFIKKGKRMTVNFGKESPASLMDILLEKLCWAGAGRVAEA